MFDWLAHLARSFSSHSILSRRGKGVFSRKSPTLAVELLEAREVPASANFQVVNAWSTGFQGMINIVNDQTTPITNWKLEFDFSSQISQIWNASISSHTSTHYVVNNAGHNSTIAANSSVSFGFVGSLVPGMPAPTNYILNGT